MSKVKDFTDIQLSEQEEIALLSLENELLNDNKEPNIRKSLDSEDLYNHKLEYDKYIKELEENAEVFNQDELETLKTEQAFEEYLKLPEDKKRELFSLSFNDDFDKIILDNDFNDELIFEEEDTKIDFD